MPDGAVARLGPDAFRYPGFANLAAYSPDGKRVAVASYAGVIVWDAATGKRLLWVPHGDRSLVGFLPGLDLDFAD